MAKYNISENKKDTPAYYKAISKKVVSTYSGRIFDIIVNKRKYLDKDYSAAKLAVDLGVSTRVVSGVVNIAFGMNYASFVNGYRIKDAMAILGDKRNSHLTMEVISGMVGFSNRQSFYASFYRILGITPNEYRSQRLGL